MRACAKFAAACILGALVWMPHTVTTAAELVILTNQGATPGVRELAAAFERVSGHKVTVEYGTLGAITDRVMKGEAADLVIVTGDQNEKLQKEGKVLAGSRAELAKTGYSVFVKSGAARPDHGTVDAFKRTMLAAKSVALGDPAGGGPLGIYSAGLMQRLGLAEDLKPRIKLLPSGTQVAEAVAQGDSEVGIGLASVSDRTSRFAASPRP